jgi:hypothetical protein
VMEPDTRLEVVSLEAGLRHVKPDILIFWLICGCGYLFFCLMPLNRGLCPAKRDFKMVYF